LTRDITNFVAEFFTKDNNVAKAKALLNDEESKIPRKECMVISFFCGGTIMT